MASKKSGLAAPKKRRPRGSKKKDPWDELLDKLIAAGMVAAAFLFTKATDELVDLVEKLREREKAIDHAQSIGGRFGKATLGADNQTHWVVWRDGVPKRAFPPFKGDLGSELSDYDQKQLEEPSKLARERTKRAIRKVQRILRKRRGPDTPGTKPT